MKFKNLIIGISFLLVSCSGSDDNDSGDMPNTPTPNLKAAMLEFPEENSICNEGKNITETESTVNFRWLSANGAENYRLVVTDAETKESLEAITTNKTNADVRIKSNHPYQWKVIAVNAANSEISSPQWSFYNAGAPVESYAPFPAQAKSPKNGEILKTTTVRLEWLASDLDNDILTYNLYFGTTNNPELIEENLSENTSDITTVVLGNTYYWKVITKDASGNTSTSVIFTFSVE